jgi:hypothetical protein
MPFGRALVTSKALDAAGPDAPSCDSSGLVVGIGERGIMRRFITRLALLTSLGVVVAFAGEASGSAGDPLLIGKTSNDAGTFNTKLSTASGGYGLWVAQGGAGAGFKATTGATGGDAVFASTANPATSAVHAINSGGGPAARFEGNVSVSGVCSGCDARQPFVITALDKPGDVGKWTSITIGRDGLGLISYSDDTNGDLKVAHCSNPACSSATITTLDHPSTANVGWGTSITIGRDGLGLISYLDYSNDRLKVAHCSNIACTAATRTALADAEIVKPTSLVIGADGLGIVAYRDLFGPLKVAHCSNVACTSATTATVDNVSAGWMSIALDSVGAPMIAYEAGGDLKWATCITPACPSWSAKTLLDYQTTSAEGGTSLAMTADGKPVMTFIDGSGHVTSVTCSFGCGSATQAGALDFSSGPGTSLTLGSDGAPVFAFFADRPDPDPGGSPTRGLGVTRCRSDCAEWGTDLVDGGGATTLVGQYPAITIGTDGYPLISYYDDVMHNLKVVHCSSTFCVPYLRRR